MLSNDEDFDDQQNQSSDDMDNQRNQTQITNRKNLPSTEAIISKVRKVIYDSLWNYWYDSESIGLIATLLNL